MTPIILQIAQTIDTLNKTLAGAHVLPTQPAPEITTLLDIIMKGGIIMISTIVYSLNYLLSFNFIQSVNIFDYVCNTAIKNIILCPHRPLLLQRMLKGK